jgi:hypothetical protein
MSASLAANSGSLERLKGADAMRLQVVRRPDPLHRAQRDAGRRGQRAAGPVGRLAGWLGAGQRDHALGHGGAQRRLAGLAGGIAQQTVDAGGGEALLPAPHRGPADAGASGDLSDAQPLSRVEDDPSPRHVLLSAIAIGHDRLEPSTIVSGNQGAKDLSHGPNMPHRPVFVNLLFVSVH